MNEAVQIIERRFEYFPQKFKWQGQIFNIDAIEDCHTEMWGDSPKVRYHFKVWSGNQAYRLTQDLSRGCWFVQQWH